jgi:hypothetical protein
MEHAAIRVEAVCCEGCVVRLAAATTTASHTLRRPSAPARAWMTPGSGWTAQW